MWHSMPPGVRLSGFIRCVLTISITWPRTFLRLSGVGALSSHSTSSGLEMLSRLKSSKQGAPASSCASTPPNCYMYQHAAKLRFWIIHGCASDELPLNFLRNPTARPHKCQRSCRLDSSQQSAMQDSVAKGVPPGFSRFQPASYCRSLQPWLHEFTGDML